MLKKDLIKRIAEQEKIIERLENELKLICEMYYEDKEREEIEKWIDEIKLGSDKE